MVVDPGRGLLLSPNEINDFQLITTANPSVFNFSQSGFADSAALDAAAVDCSTGIALSSVQRGSQVLVVDLNPATFAGPGWSAPSNLQTLPEFTRFSTGTVGVAVAPGSSHIGIVAGGKGAGFGVIRLPATSGGTPAVLDWVAADVPREPGGAPWLLGASPQMVSAYASPSSGRAFAVMANTARTYLAVVDLQALLSAPRQTGTHNINPSVDLSASGILRFVSIH